MMAPQFARVGGNGKEERVSRFDELDRLIAEGSKHAKQHNTPEEYEAQHNTPEEYEFSRDWQIRRARYLRETGKVEWKTDEGKING